MTTTYKFPSLVILVEHQEEQGPLERGGGSLGASLEKVQETGVKVAQRVPLVRLHDRQVRVDKVPRRFSSWLTACSLMVLYM